MTAATLQLAPANEAADPASATLRAAYYAHPCFVCALRTNCPHREPSTELAIATWRAPGASLETE